MHIHIKLAVYLSFGRFSRRIIWLEVSTTNNNPAVIAHFYIKSIKLLQGVYNNYCNNYCYDNIFISGVPSIVRADLGTENSIIASIQPFLRRHGIDSARNMSFRYGHSVSNQVFE